MNGERKNDNTMAPNGKINNKMTVEWPLVCWFKNRYVKIWKAFTPPYFWSL